MRTRIFAILAAVATLPSLGCDEVVLAMGDVNSIIVTADPALWAQVESPVVPTLERNVFTVRDEKTFKVTYQDPGEQAWFSLRIFKQQLLIGRPDDPWMVDAVAKLDDPVSPPQLVQVYDVWARNQLVTLLLLAEDSGPEAVTGLLPTVADLYDRQYREWVLSRMFVSGRDTALARELKHDARFTLMVPDVYTFGAQDSVYVFRNDNPDPSELIRQVTVTWRSPIPEGVQGEDLLAWRAELVEDYYNFPQVVDLEKTRAEAGQVKGNHAYTIQSVWLNPPDGFPAAGPFITQGIVCLEQNRMYLVDAWLYAPGKEKYEYMIQLEEILSSFDCNGL